jgi:hypothetical protein
MYGLKNHVDQPASTKMYSSISADKSAANNPVRMNRRDTMIRRRIFTSGRGKKKADL